MRRAVIVGCGLLMLGGLIVGGCASAAKPVISGPDIGSTTTQAQKQESMGTGNELIVEGRNRGTIKLLAVKVSRPNGYLQLQIGFQNTANRDQYLEYEVHFMDANGMPIPETSGWKPLSVTGRGVAYGQVVCIKKEAETFKVHMKYK